MIGIYESKDQETKLLIHYKNWAKKFDELIPLNSHRLSWPGFYTSRLDIPRYDDLSTNINKKPVLNLPWGQILEDARTKINEEIKNEFEEEESISWSSDWGELNEEDL